MNSIEREKLIHHYLEAYNGMDVNAMLEVLDKDILFENYSSGEKTHELCGMDAFQKQAEEALGYFSERKQSIEVITHREDESEIHISYRAIAAMDLPNGMKKGQEIRLHGKSIFRFSEEKISEIRDYS
ncbi:nuclear transport factor 2 family protein [Algoriphagus sp.]|uniref:nuclear transport factor 2 family protein n=1 Tax=Algoriphagus sp. TaxID=1872435 RepID=UPI003919E281